MNSKKIRHTTSDKIFYSFIYTVLTLISIIILYPLVFIVASSFSSGHAITSGKVFIYPVEFNIDSYKAVFTNSGILVGYRNTLLYTTIGTFIDVFFTLACAYPLSRKDMPCRSVIMFYLLSPCTSVVG